MRSRRAATRYAKVMVEIAGEAGRIEEVRAELERVTEACRELGYLTAFLTDTKVSDERKHEAVSMLASDLGLSRETANFLHVLVERRRFGLIEDIRELYDELADRALGYVHVKVRTAAPLDEGELEAIKERFARITGEKPVLEVEEDPSLMGGVQVEVENKVYDYSVAGSLENLRERLVTKKD